jgi:hypothetical protein
LRPHIPAIRALETAMARMLARSKSLRILKGSHKETHRQDTEALAPQHAVTQNDFDGLKAATPVTRADGRLETPEPLQRPKTAGGPGDRSKLFHRKVTPAALSSEDRSLSFVPSPSTTVLYAAEVHEDSDGVIGIALGSPTMASHWNTTPQSADFVTSNQGTVTHIFSHNSFADSVESKHEAPKPKISRWKSIFGKKTPVPQQQQTPFYQLQQSASPARADSHHEEEVWEPHSFSRTQSPAIFRPEIRESRKKNMQRQASTEKPRPRTEAESVTGCPKASRLRAASSPKPPPKDSRNDSPTVPEVVISNDSQNALPRATGDKPLLDVDIPKIEMERYSVMFGNLLQPNRSSSLLVRRQGNVEKLKPLNELSMKVSIWNLLELAC